MDENNVKLKNFLLDYSIEDLLKSFFVLNLWLPNVASPIKSQYLYVIFESIFDKLPKENKITEYNHFKKFVQELLLIVPSFPMMEDYLPENDWGEIKYFLNKKFYRTLYGGDLSNPYDFCYSFEVIHRGFEEYYLEKLGRSPIKEFEFCLTVQDKIINGIDVKAQDKRDVELGGFSLPSEEFWQAAVGFLDNFDPTSNFSPDLIKEYTKDLDSARPIEVPPEEDFLSRAHDGKNCFYFFLKKSGRFFPVLPRKYFAVLFDKWGKILSEHYPSTVKEIKHYEIKIGVELYHFIKQRVREEELFFICSAIQDDLKPHKTIFTTAFRSKNKLILVHVLPPPTAGTTQQKMLESLIPELQEAQNFFTKSPTRLGLHGEEKMVQFESTKGEGRTALEPLIITVIPHITTDFGMIGQPKDLVGEIIGLDQFLGIIDEIEDLHEIADFFEYVESMQDSFSLSPMTSYLDRFGSFRDSHSVLIPGANTPNLVVLDPHWGTDFRYRSLSKFWEIFPEENFFGHPRGWTIPADRKTKTGFILNSRTFFGYAYYQKIGQASFFINAPVHRMELDEGGINDSIMQSLFDAIDIYPNIIEKLNFTKSHNKVQIFFCPSSIALKEDELAHVRHLVQNTNLWAMDCARLQSMDYGVRVVYNLEKMMEALRIVADRSIQIQLLVDVLEQLNTLVAEPDLANIRSELEKEKNKKARFKTFMVEKKVSFPEGIRTLLPDQKEYKLADKEIAKIALGLNIQPGSYSADEGKRKLNNLRNKLVQFLNIKIQGHNLGDAIPVLLEKSNALIHDSWHAEEEIKASRDHEVDYEREGKSSENEKKFLHWYKVYRYLIEKFVQLQPGGNTKFSNQHLKELLVFADRLIDIYVASDFINYELYPVNVNIDRDYIVSTSDEKNDIASMEKEYGKEQAKINLGIIGKKEDTADSNIPIEDYLDELDRAFKKDFAFGLKNFVNVQQVLALWAVDTEKGEGTYYYATSKEIASACAKQIKGYDISETDAILNFLALKPEGILTIKGEQEPAEDIPVWEHTKRPMRFDIRPLIKIDGHYYWGPHSIDRTSHIWMGISSKHKLPSDLDAPTVKAVLNRGHENLRNCLVEKIKEIALRHTNNVEKGVYPHKYDETITDIGDYDVLAYLKNKNVLLNIESKIIDPPYSNKDSGRMQRKIFGEMKRDTIFKGGYLQRVEKRANHLKTKGRDLVTKLGWDTPTLDPKVISVFATKMGFWWTKFPPVKTEVNFIEVRLLDQFIKNL
ncbi:hypothetical protein KJ786_00135 [Patescibacteria group bacterium]|nr:hypothetical protein [Patescibacteria group bacterium]